MPLGVDLLTVQRGLRAGTRRLLRDRGTGTSFAALLGLLLLCQFLLFMMLGLEGGIQLLEERMDLRLEIIQGATDPQIQDLFQNLRSLPYVEDVVYITREQAMERMRAKDPELLSFIDKFGVQNPFPETMGVRLRNISDYPLLLSFLQQPSFAAVVNPDFLSTTTDQEAQILTLIHATRAAHAVVLFVVLLLGIVLLFVVIELIRRRATSRREELFITQLLGASRGFILFPFFAEIVIVLLFALLFSLIIAALLFFFIPFALPTLSGGGVFGEWARTTNAVLSSSILWIVLSEIVGVFCLAMLGTLFALKDQFVLTLRPHASLSA